MWNNLILSFFRIDIDIRQESALFLNLSTLYIAPIFHIFKKGQRISFKIWLFHFYLLWMIVFLFHRKNLLKYQISFFFVVITLLLLSLIKFNLQLSMESWKSFTFSHWLETSTPSFGSYSFRWLYSLTEEYLKISWLYLWQKILLLSIYLYLFLPSPFYNQRYGNARQFYEGLLTFYKWLLYYTYILLIILYRLLTLFVLLPPGKLRLLLALFLFIYIWTSLVVVIRWEQCPYLLIILSSYCLNTTHYLSLDKVTLKDSKNQELYCRC